LHHDPGPQVPLELQNCPQHSDAAAHGFPSVLQVVLRGVHVLFSHKPPQHSPF
jgi:hypothetical protein